MKFDTKIAVVVRNDLQSWQKLNITAFTVTGIASTVEGIKSTPARRIDSGRDGFVGREDKHR